ncbi:hypothetical protein BGX29_007143, partial [Mortierella sp. GBA35]
MFFSKKVAIIAAIACLLLASTSVEAAVPDALASECNPPVECPECPLRMFCKIDSRR